MQEKMNKIQFWKKHPGKKCAGKNRQNAILEKTFWKKLISARCTKNGKTQFWKKHSGKNKVQEKVGKIQPWKKYIAPGKHAFWKKHIGKNL